MMSPSHVCALFDVGNQGGTDFRVMEHLEGEMRSQRLIEGALPTGQALARHWWELHTPELCGPLLSRNCRPAPSAVAVH